MFGQVFEAASEEHWSFFLAPIPPASKATLWVRVDENNGPLPSSLGLHG
jgi:hypothetical protein